MAFALISKTITSLPSTIVHPLQVTDPDEFDRQKKFAEEDFPDDDPSVALSKRVQKCELEGIFFLDSNGVRSIWGEEVRVSIMKGPYGTIGLVEERAASPSDERKYHRRRYPLSLAQINRPKRLEVAEIIAHSSEKGWNLPVEHKRHFSKFPEEIRNLIFQFALTVPAPLFLQPHVNDCNWVQCWSAPSYSVKFDLWEELSYMSLVSVQRQDECGLYLKLHNLYRKPIDASFLRTSSEIYQMGNRVLYSGNEFFFSTQNRRNPPSLMAKGKVWRPNPHKPTFYEDWKSQVNTVIRQIEHRVPLLALRGWAYYDPFLRFLYVIGPKIAAHLKSLKFSGVIRVHICSLECDRGRCGDDLIMNLRLYVPFIKKFCPDLEKLTLYVKKEEFPITMRHLYPEGAPITGEESLLSLIENQLRELPMLTELLVLDGQDKCDSLVDWNLDSIEPAVQWFKERSKQRARNALEELQIRLQSGEMVKENAELSCDFCGESHVWAECWNLCNFCGGYGHYRRQCPRNSN